jgi:hypothetical protein
MLSTGRLDKEGVFYKRKGQWVSKLISLFSEQDTYLVGGNVNKLVSSDQSSINIPFNLFFRVLFQNDF